MKKFLITTTLFFSIFSSALAAKEEYLIQIKDHKFIPEILEIPAKKEFILIVENLDRTLEEFESDDLKKEKLVRSGKKIKLNIQALETGEYRFYGDFHQKTAQGKIIVK
jgi:hypothetical protein